MKERPDSAVTALPGVQIGGEAVSRGDVILKGALAAGALYGLGAIGPYVSDALAGGARDDVDILNFLLPFEYLQAAIYNRGKSELNDKGEKMPLKSEEKALVEGLLADEGRHVSALKKAVEELGGKPVRKGAYAFAFINFDEFLRLAREIETSAIGAYNGAIPSLKSTKARELAGSIVQVEGRHAAALLIRRKEEPAPAAFDEGLLENTAIISVGKFTGVFE
jgi:rubrerythrin